MTIILILNILLTASNLFLYYKTNKKVIVETIEQITKEEWWFYVANQDINHAWKEFAKPVEIEQNNNIIQPVWQIQ